MTGSSSSICLSFGAAPRAATAACAGRKAVTSTGATIPTRSRSHACAEARAHQRSFPPSARAGAGARSLSLSLSAARPPPAPRALSQLLLLALRSYALTVVLEPDVACSTIGAAARLLAELPSFANIGGTGSAERRGRRLEAPRAARRHGACAATMYRR